MLSNLLARNARFLSRASLMIPDTFGIAEGGAWVGFIETELVLGIVSLVGSLDVTASRPFPNRNLARLSGT